MASHAKTTARHKLSVAGLFAGIGGIELGLHRAGHTSRLLCEVDPGATRVLETRFKGVEVASDVRELASAGSVDLLTAGFPCQDLSQAGRTKGIRGRNSGLVGHVFRLLDSAGKRGPKWLLLENVSFMLHLDQGNAMRYLVDELELRGYSWAYRVVDTRAFGLPQRRQRVILLASKTEDPRGVLLSEDAGEPALASQKGLWCGFYWTKAPGASGGQSTRFQLSREARPSALPRRLLSGTRVTGSSLLPISKTPNASRASTRIGHFPRSNPKAFAVATDGSWSAMPSACPSRSGSVSASLELIQGSWSKALRTWERGRKQHGGTRARCTP